jgi:hypothetical protein
MTNFVLSTPSFGITWCSRLVPSHASRTFNSLSRDHLLLHVLEELSSEALSTPSLGITMCAHIPNSCSTTATLSTPSLGITQKESVCEPSGGDQDGFQLPLSGSRSACSERARPSAGQSPFPSFQLPLSGSRVRRGVDMQLRGLPTFNSLSRDHSPKRSSLSSARRTFNSLSRDHRARFRDFPALRGFLPRRPFAQMISKTTIWIYLFAPL